MTVIDSASRFQKAAAPSSKMMPLRMTPFERDLTIAYEMYKNNPAFTHLCVALRYDVNSRESYIDPQSKKLLPATVDIFPLEREDCPIQTMQVMGVYKDPVVIMVDLRGPALQDQIAGWNPGTIHYPGHFAADPAINIQTESRAERPPTSRRVLGVIQGGLSL